MNRDKATAATTCLQPASGRTARTRLRFVEAVAVIAACLYAPFSWILVLWATDPADSYKWHWLKLWPVLPGFVPGAYFLHGRGDGIEITAWAGTTLVLLVCLGGLAARGRVGLVTATAIALMISVPSAWLAYALFRA